MNVMVAAQPAVDDWHALHDEHSAAVTTLYMMESQMIIDDNQFGHVVVCIIAVACLWRLVEIA